MSRYAVGAEFGTESGRAVLVDVADGHQLATAVHTYANGVIDERLPAPDEAVALPPDRALQDPEEDLRVFSHAVLEVPEHRAVDDTLDREYVRLHDDVGRGEADVMKTLRGLRTGTKASPMRAARSA